MNEEAISPERSPTMVMLEKRLRTQRKRLTKVERYQQLDQSKLNADQIETISRKTEILGNIKELEGILEQVLIIEAEALEITGKKNNILEKEKKMLIDVAIEKQERLHQENIRYMCKISFALNLPFSSLIGSHSITEDEFNVLTSLKSSLVCSNQDNPNAFADAAESCFKRILSGDEEFIDGTKISFAQARLLLDRLLLAPRPEPKFGMFEVTAKAAENTKTVAQSVYMPEMSYNFFAPVSRDLDLKLSGVGGIKSEVPEMKETKTDEKVLEAKKKRFRKPAKPKAAVV